MAINPAAAKKARSEANLLLSDHWTDIGPQVVKILAAVRDNPHNGIDPHEVSDQVVDILRKQTEQIANKLGEIDGHMTEDTTETPEEPTPGTKKISDILPDGTIMAPDGTNSRVTAAEKDPRYLTPFKINDTTSIAAALQLKADAVIFTCSPDRGHSKNSSFSRSEWREYFNGKEAKWNSKGTHTIEGVYSFESHLKARNQASIQQLHDEKDDVWQVVVDNGKVIEKGSKKVLSETVPVKFTVKSVVTENQTDFYFDGVLKFSLPLTKKVDLYFKSGCYLQTSKAKYGELPTAWAATTIHSLKVSHAA